jgi:hypothetical protein
MKLSRYFSRIGYFLIVGLLATATMDVVALATVKTGIVHLGPYRIVPELLGRWVGCFPTGTFLHSTILATPSVPHEKLVGLVSHYLIGLTLSSVLLFPHVRVWHRRVTFRTGVVFGLATCIFPWFLMFPAMGFGIMALRLPNPTTLTLFSACNHVAFGIGIFLWNNLIPLFDVRCAEPSKENLRVAAS